MTGIPAGHIRITIDLGQVIRFKRGMNVKKEKVFGEAADRYLKYLHSRFIALSSGGGWPPLEESTVKRKEQRKKKYGTPAHPRWILRETNQLLNNIETASTREGFRIGYLNRKIHKGTKDRRKSRISVSKLAEIHHFGIGQKVRPIVVVPNGATLRLMVQAIQKKYGEIIKEAKWK